MGTLDQIIKTLETHGPWALVVIAGLVIWRMATHITNLNQRHRAELVALLREQKEDTRELTEALVSTKQALENMQAALSAAIR